MNPKTQAFIHWEAQRRAAAGDRGGALELIGLIEPPDAASEILRGRTLAQDGQFVAAAEAFQAALKSEPSNEEAKQGLALAERLARSPLGWIRIHARRVVVGLAVISVMVFAAVLWAGSVSNRELAQSISALDKKVTAAQGEQQVSVRELTERIKRLESDLENLAAANGRSNEHFRDQLRKLQAQLGSTVTDEQMKTARREMMESLKRLEEAAGLSKQR